MFFYFIFTVLSNYKFSYIPLNSSVTNSSWIYPSQKKEFYFHLFDGDSILSEDQEKGLISSGVLPVIYISDTETVLNAEIETDFNQDSWRFFFIAKTPGSFCFKIKPNIDTSISIIDSDICFAVSYFLSNDRQCILGQINLSTDITPDIFIKSGIKRLHQIQSSPLSLFSTMIIEMDSKVTSPFFSRNITLISPNDFADSYYIIYDFSAFPELISEISNIYFQPDNNIFIQAGSKSLRIHVDQSYDILDEDTDISYLGCNLNKCNYMFYTNKDENNKHIRFYQKTDEFPIAKEEEIICCTFGSKNPDRLIIVLENNISEYIIRTFTLGQTQIIDSKEFEYLKQEPKKEFFSNPKIVVPSLEFENSSQPIIEGIHSHQNHDENIYIYGTSLVYSPSYGNGWFLLGSFQPYKIVDFTSSPSSGKFAFRTNDPEHTLYIGSIGNRLFSQLSLKQVMRNEYSIDMDKVADFSRLFYSSEDNLYLVKFDKETASFERLIISIENTKFDESECPYFMSSVNSNNDILVTREREVEGFPEKIYLDHNSLYSFNMIFSKKKDSFPDVNLKGRSLLNIEKLIINDNLSDTISLYANITENQNEILHSDFNYNAKLNPGEYIEEVPIIISVLNSSPRCSFSQASITAYLGCPYGFVFEIEPTTTMCSKDPDIQCPDYSQRWNPKFRLRDSLNNSTRPYTGMFDLMIIGYGSTRDQMKVINNSKDLYDFNYGSKPMWGYDSSERTGIASDSNSTIIWLCAEGSPCARVSPKFPDTPKLYLRFFVSTNISFDNSTYCSYESTFDICLSSLPYPFAYQMITIIATLFVCVVINLIRFYKYAQTYTSSFLSEDLKEKKLI